MFLLKLRVLSLRNQTFKTNMKSAWIKSYYKTDNQATYFLTKYPPVYLKADTDIMQLNINGVFIKQLQIEVYKSIRNFLYAVQLLFTSYSTVKILTQR